MNDPLRATTLPSTLRSLAPLVGLLVIGAAVFIPVLTGYWLADDFDWVREFYRYPWSDAPRLFLGDWSRAISQEYRPLWAISFMIDLRLWGLSPMALHVTNLVLHLVACLLVWHLTATVTGADKLAAPLALAFFALAPIHAEPVSWISARGHILAPVFVLAALILLRRFEQHRHRVIYLCAIGCALGAFATQEVAVVLPPLLLLRDVVDAPRRDRQWVRRMIILHAPFWGMLAAYLVFRYFTFGMLGRQGTLDSIPGLLQQQRVALHALWLSPLTAFGLPGGTAGSVIRAAGWLAIAALLVASLIAMPTHARSELARGLLFFAVLWPFVCTAVLFGAASSRHFYLASVGVAVALGLASSRLLTSVTTRPGLALACAVGLGVLLGVSAAGLAFNSAHFARSGRLSRELAEEVDRAFEVAGKDPQSVTVIIPEFPGHRGIFWDYFYPDALGPPFRRGRPTQVLPSFASCHCLPEEWKTAHAATLARLKDGSVSEVHVVAWSAQHSKFVTRSLSQRAFWQAGYAARDGPLVRPRRPGLPTPELP